MKEYLKKNGVTLLLVGFIAFWLGYNAKTGNCISCLFLPQEAPAASAANVNWTLQDLTGQEQSLSKLAKPVTVLAFWGTECPVCLKEMPELEQFYQAHKNDPVALIGITANDAEVDTITATIAEKKVHYPILLGNAEIRDAYSEHHKLPAIFVLDQQRRVTASFHGGITANELNEAVKPLIASQ